MNKVYIGIDNGVTGSIGIIGTIIPPVMSPTPTIVQQSYTKEKQNISRLNVKEFKKILSKCAEWDVIGSFIPVLAIIERPMVNFLRFKASLSAIRCLEAQLCILESMNIPYMYIDSKEWQRELLPCIRLKKKEGESKKEKLSRQRENSRQLKKVSMDIGIRLFPHLKETIEKHHDADSLLIAEYANRQGL